MTVINLAKTKAAAKRELFSTNPPQYALVYNSEDLKMWLNCCRDGLLLASFIALDIVKWNTLAYSGLA